jgi:3-isopropylmalate/(R)-2-methylmalate dehydratase large subunit
MHRNPAHGQDPNLYDKIWTIIRPTKGDGTCLIYIDRHLVHEVTSPQAFEGLRLAGRKVRAPEKTLCVVDHNVPTTDRRQKNPDPESEQQIAYLAENAKFFGLEYFDEFDRRQGIVHHRAEQAHAARRDARVRRQPHGDAWRLRPPAYGIGTAEVEHARHQTLIRKSRRTCAPSSTASCRRASPPWTSPAIIGEIGTAGGTGYALNMPARRSARCRWKAA